MISPSILDRFSSQYDDLKTVVESSRSRVIAADPDPLFYDNQNVFVKAYLVSACSMLEAFIQDLAEAYMMEIQTRINNANLPYNFVAWLMSHDKARLDYAKFEGKKTKKDISEMLSPNYHKTITAFERIGVRLTSAEMSAYKDYISSTIDKRNKIVHHNDSASDLSFSDIITAIEEFRKYGEYLFRTVCSDPHVVAQ